MREGKNVSIKVNSGFQLASQLKKGNYSVGGGSDKEKDSNLIPVNGSGDKPSLWEKLNSRRKQLCFKLLVSREFDDEGVLEKAEERSNKLSLLRAKVEEQKSDGDVIDSMFTERKRNEIADKNKHYRGFRFKESGPVVKEPPSGLSLTTWSSDDEDAKDTAPAPDPAQKSLMAFFKKSNAPAIETSSLLEAVQPQANNNE